MDIEIVVSIICNTYNHEKHIRCALEGFVMQKTDFAFEVLIHDDASTDNTATIIKEYEHKYPNLIKPIYQKENQYSRGVSISRVFQYPRAKGKYIALCEGDDYWTDPYKLQKQVNALEAHPEIDICAHAANTVRDEKIVGIVAPVKESSVLSIEQVIQGGGGYVTTASLMYRQDMLDAEYAFHHILSLDYVTQIRGSLRGGMLYLSDCMSVYRLAVDGSWTVRMQKRSDMYAKHMERVNEMLRVLDEETNYRYAKTIQKKIALNEVGLLMTMRKYREVLTRRHWRGFQALSLKNKIKVCVYAVCPQMADFRHKQALN